MADLAATPPPLPPSDLPCDPHHPPPLVAASDFQIALVADELGLVGAVFLEAAHDAIAQRGDVQVASVVLAKAKAVAARIVGVAAAVVVAAAGTVGHVRAAGVGAAAIAAIAAIAANVVAAAIAVAGIAEAVEAGSASVFATLAAAPALFAAIVAGIAGCDVAVLAGVDVAGPEVAEAHVAGAGPRRNKPHNCNSYHFFLCRGQIAKQSPPPERF